MYRVALLRDALKAKARKHFVFVNTPSEISSIVMTRGSSSGPTRHRKKRSLSPGSKVNSKSGYDSKNRRSTKEMRKSVPSCSGSPFLRLFPRIAATSSKLDSKKPGKRSCNRSSRSRGSCSMVKRKENTFANQNRAVSCKTTAASVACNQAAEARWNKFHKGWCETVGSIPHPHEKRARLVWLCKRPPQFGRDFGIGCLFCNSLSLARPPGAGKRSAAHSDSFATPIQKATSAVSKSKREADSDRRFNQRVHTKWARFDVHTYSNMQSSSIRKHAGSSVHKLAVIHYLNPQAKLTVAEDPDQVKLFTGNVPQLSTYIKVWRFLKNPISFSDAEAMTLTAVDSVPDSHLERCV
jgi:hypothetical protein